MKITKAKIRKAVYKILGDYGLARPPLADDLAEAVFDMLKAVEQKMHPTLLESEPILNDDGELIGTRSVEIQNTQNG